MVRFQWVTQVQLDSIDFNWMQLVQCDENKSDHWILLKGHIQYFYLLIWTIKIQLCRKNGTERGEESAASGIFEDTEDFVF